MALADVTLTLTKFARIDILITQYSDIKYTLTLDNEPCRYCNSSLNNMSSNVEEWNLSCPSFTVWNMPSDDGADLLKYYEVYDTIGSGDYFQVDGMRKHCGLVTLAYVLT